MDTQTVIVFPNFASALGGAQSARIGVRFAWVTLAAGGVIRVSRKHLPTDPRDWTAFTLADTAERLAYRGEAKRVQS